MEEVVEGTVACPVCHSLDTVLFHGKWTPRKEYDGREVLIVVEYKDPSIYAFRCAQCGRHTHMQVVSATVLE